MIRELPIALILAQSTVTPSSEWYSPLLNAGAMGVMLLFFMWQSSKKEDDRIAAQRADSSAMNAMAKSNMIIVLALKGLDANVASLAQQLKEEIEKNEAGAPR